MSFLRADELPGENGKNLVKGMSSLEGEKAFLVRNAGLTGSRGLGNACLAGGHWMGNAGITDGRGMGNAGKACLRGQGGSSWAGGYRLRRLCSRQLHTRPSAQSSVFEQLSKTGLTQISTT